MIVDFRIHFEDEKPKNGVPVAVVHIETDSDKQELWFQMPQSEIERIIQKLTVASTQMELSARLFRAAVEEDDNK